MISRMLIRPPGQNRGFSLVIVLAAVALLVILMVAFLSSVSTDLQSSKVYSSGSALRLLSESAANLAIGQIRVATSDSSLCWASQPGMIRTFDASGPAGYYKLYSDSNMQGTGAFNPNSAANAVPATWASQKGVYVDLNQPVTINSTNYFPILDGDSADMVSFSSTLAGGTVQGLGSGTTPPVEGYWLKGAPVDSTSPNQAPMPVKWLYVLQEGQIIVPASVSGGVVSFSGATMPSKTNQIVGRIAFWTDDETCKVNVNTASEGSFWDSPRTYTYQDYYLGMSQPVQGEFQRYPGHPAMVCLSSVLGLDSGTTTLVPGTTIAHEDIFPLSPYTKAGGTVGGTVNAYKNLSNGPTAIAQSVSRLYTSVDEFMFQTSISGGNRLQNSALLTNPSALDAGALKRSRFFLTANSQAPDVNVFNLPRVSMWPITLGKTTGQPAMTAIDKLIAFAGTINNHIFYFQRQDPNSITTDLPNGPTDTGLGRNRGLLSYLRTLTGKSVPGFGPTSFEGKYGDDRQQIITEIFDYIRCTNLVDSGTLATPYTVSFDNSSTTSKNGGLGQVLPIVDNTINIKDVVSGASSHPKGFGRFQAVQQAALVFIGVEDTGTDAYVPALAPGDKYPGFSGSYATLNGSATRVQAALVVQMFDPSSGPSVSYPWYEVTVEGADSLQWSNDGAAYTSMYFPSPASLGQPFTLSGVGASQLLFGGVNDFRDFSMYKGAPGSANTYPLVTPPTGRLDPAPATCPDMNGTIYLKGGTITVNVYGRSSAGARGDLVAKSTLKFPQTSMPVPTVIHNTGSTMFKGKNIATTNLRSFYDGGGLIGRINMDPLIGWVSKEDSVRAVLATPGDMRLVAPRSDVPQDLYGVLSATGSEYSLSTVRSSHMLRYGLAFPANGGAGGRLVGVNYSGYQGKYDFYGSGTSNPYNDFGFYNRVTTTVTGTLVVSSTSGGTYARAKDTIVNSQTNVYVAGTGSVPGDWDNGLANNVDGAFINKADEGDGGSGGGQPYIELDYGNALPGDAFYTANRMVPSPGILGSLPTGVWKNEPWKTLLFRPGPANHPGLASPPDHLIMDLFNMPVVEPYAISTPLATAGRVNMNYQIVPFTYIHRDTGLRAVMKSQMVTVIPSPSGGNIYKNYQNPANAVPGGQNGPANMSVRFPINSDLTLSQFQTRFDSGDIFRSASEICTIDLVPSGTLTSLPAALPVTRAQMDTFWSKYPVTGDNTRERPYANIYPLLTTKSNTFTVHMRVQTLKQVPGGDYTTWREGKDQVTGQYRGSQLVERYIDPKDTLPDYATDPSTSDTLSQHYKFRTLANRQFAP